MEIEEALRTGDIDMNYYANELSEGYNGMVSYVQAYAWLLKITG